MFRLLVLIAGLVLAAQASAEGKRFVLEVDPVLVESGAAKFILPRVFPEDERSDRIGV